jgi:hypothetical protein
MPDKKKKIVRTVNLTDAQRLWIAINSLADANYKLVDALTRLGDTLDRIDAK